MRTSVLSAANSDISDRCNRFIVKIRSFPKLEFTYITTTANSAADCLSRYPELAKFDNKPETAENKATKETNTVEARATQVNLDNSHQETKLRLEKIHLDNGHMCASRCISILKMHYPTSVVPKSLISDVFDNCSYCLKNRRLAPENMVGEMATPKAPNECLHWDHFTPGGFDATNNAKAVLSMRDSYSRFTILKPCAGYSHSEALQHLRDYCAIFGPPKTLRTDNFFISEVTRDFCSRHNIQLIPTAAYRPQNNGLIERVHKDVRKLLPLCMEKLGITNNNFCDALPMVSQIINNNICATTGVTPNSLHLAGDTDDLSRNKNLPKYDQIRTKIITAKDKQSRPLSGPFKETELEAGDAVWAFLKDNNNPVPAIILQDHGQMVNIRKCSDHEKRFKEIPIHKSRVSIRV